MTRKRLPGIDVFKKIYDNCSIKIDNVFFNLTRAHIILIPLFSVHRL